MNYVRRYYFLAAAVLALILSTASLNILSAATAPSLGTAGAFAVLGGSAVTNTGPTVINGDLGVSPGSAVTGFPPGIVIPPSTIHAADAVAAGAQSDSVTAYNSLAGQPCNFTLTGTDLGGLTLIPGVYCFTSSAQLTGALTLNGQGNPGAVFIFQIASTLTTASNSSVNLINGASACDVFWQVGSSATLGTATSFIGNILASASITLNTGASLSGSALAQSGAVTLDSNSVSIAQCNGTFVAAPTIAKAFGAAAIGVGGTTTLSFTINNPNATIALAGVAFTDTLPTNLIASTPNGLTGSCGGGAITAVAGSGSVSLTGATLAGGASCTFSVNVTGTATGAANNSVTVTSTNGGTGNISLASLTVLQTPPATAAPTITKAFGAAAIGVGGTTTLSFTINNPNAMIALSGVAFIDTLPGGLIVSTPNGLTGSCGGGTITAVAGSGSVSLAGATLAGGASCTFLVNVTGTTTGAANNSVTVSSTNGGTGNTSLASLTVLQTPPATAAPIITKAFGAAAIGVGGTTSLSFTINNPNATIALNGVAFIDTLPGGLIVSTPNGLTGSCGGGTITAVAGSGSVSLAGATLAGGASCTFSVNVTGTTTGAANNSVTVTSTNGGTGNTSLASLTVLQTSPATTAPTITKAFGAAGIGVGGTTTLTFTINNPNGTVALTGVAFIDTLPAGLAVATPNGVNGSCGGGIITATPGSGSISLISATLAAGASCTFSVNVTAAIGNVAGSFLVGYAANLQAGESLINITNTGANGASLLGPGFGPAVGNVCVNVYAFDPSEELVSCCSCLVTPDQTVNLGVNRDLLSNPEIESIGGVPVSYTSVTVKLLATLAGGGLLTNITGNVTSSNGGIGNTASAQILSGVASAGCTNSAATVTSAALANGVAAWHTTLHATPTAGSFTTTETPFTPSTLSAGELASLGGRCAAIMGNGSGAGICNSCRAGALGAAALSQ
jgi:uncharacterized repeat protein (TIGR01451 family)